MTGAVVEERIYTLLHGRVPAYLALYEASGRETQLRILGCNVGYYAVDIGPQNTLVHLWAYRSMADREVRRTALADDEHWRAYLSEVRPLMLSQETRILKPAGFFGAWVEQQLQVAEAGC